jgi:nitronate monooxygenase
VRLANRITGPALSRLPDSLEAAALARQQANVPFLSPQPASNTAPSNLLDSGPLYAGETVARIHDVRPAADLVRELSALV